MTAIYAGAALLAGGWARDVRIICEDGIISSVETGVSRSRRMSATPSSFRPCPISTATPFSAPWPDLPKFAVPVMIVSELAHGHV